MPSPSSERGATSRAARRDHHRPSGLQLYQPHARQERPLSHLRHHSRDRVGVTFETNESPMSAIICIRVISRPWLQPLGIAAGDTPRSMRIPVHLSANKICFPDGRSASAYAIASYRVPTSSRHRAEAELLFARSESGRLWLRADAQFGRVRSSKNSKPFWRESSLASAKETHTAFGMSAKTPPLPGASLTSRLGLPGALIGSRPLRFLVAGGVNTMFGLWCLCHRAADGIVTVSVARSVDDTWHRL